MAPVKQFKHTTIATHIALVKTYDINYPKQRITTPRTKAT